MFFDQTKKLTQLHSDTINGYGSIGTRTNDAIVVRKALKDAVIVVMKIVKAIRIVTTSIFDIIEFNSSVRELMEDFVTTLFIAILSMRDKFQVVESIVGSVMVDMVDVFIRWDKTSKRFPHQPMNVLKSSVDANLKIAFAIVVLNEFSIPSLREDSTVSTDKISYASWNRIEHRVV